MPIADKISPAPREVRLAGAITLLPGVAVLVLGVMVLAESGRSSAPGNNVYAEAGFYGLFGIGIVAVGIGLLLGKLWARSPGVVVALITAGAGIYLTGPSGQPGPGVPTVLAGLLVVYLLFRQPSRAWALGQQEGESEEDAARRGGIEGRAERRESED
ncbi:hypothetical protein [Amycolatopsis sp. CA-230715]|uniref:hypothetical protein n=1 Tax=Amycolatopsis sp. CA-230715 TaxID=2745196 RepID=UPI001C02D71C|nr:hypothetical protein [Amycolatopsis sp. CA-230715]QWF82275.1 hypothetical protein HUW46_05712 [Amycolatopsis sp. CA-230715]